MSRKPTAAKNYTARNRIKLVHGGAEYFDLLIQLINHATVSIHLQTYIYENDSTGLQVAAALIAAAKRKVKVHVMADGYASQALPQKFIDQLSEAGISFRFFEPFFKSKGFYFGRRLHHKIFVADSKFALTGGINIADKYNNIAENVAWLDFALYAEGEIARQMCVLCWKTWKGFPNRVKRIPCETAPAEDIPDKESVKIRLRRNDWVRGKNEISSTYFDMLRNAHTQITIVCSYFLPGKIIRDLLSKASKRGVKIKVVTAGPSDVVVAKNAERWLYDWLLRNKITLYEYQPAVLHAKVAVCDSEWFTIGSYNINNISAYASVEMNLDVRNTNFAAEMEKMLEKIISEDCISITSENHVLTKNIFRQFIRWCSYQFIRLAFFMVTFYYRQKKRKKRS